MESATWRQHCGPVSESCACQTWDHDEDYALLLNMFTDAECVDSQTFMHLPVLLTLFAEDR